MNPKLACPIVDEAETMVIKLNSLENGPRNQFLGQPTK